MATITITNDTEVPWSLLNSKAIHGTWNTEPADLLADKGSQVTFGLKDTGSPFGVDGIVEYLYAVGDTFVAARIILKSPATNINLIKATITGETYEAQSQYNADNDLVGTITFALKQI